MTACQAKDTGHSCPLPDSNSHRPMRTRRLAAQSFLGPADLGGGGRCCSPTGRCTYSFSYNTAWHGRRQQKHRGRSAATASGKGAVVEAAPSSSFESRVQWPLAPCVHHLPSDPTPALPNHPSPPPISFQPDAFHPSPTAPACFAPQPSPPIRPRPSTHPAHTSIPVLMRLAHLGPTLPRALLRPFPTPAPPPSPTSSLVLSFGGLTPCVFLPEPLR